MVVRVVVAELNGNVFVYFIPKEAVRFTLNRFRNLMSAIAGFVKIINYFIQILQAVLLSLSGNTLVGFFLILFAQMSCGYIRLKFLQNPTFKFLATHY